LEPDEDFTKMIIDDVESVGFGCKPLSYDQYKKIITSSPVNSPPPVSSAPRRRNSSTPVLPLSPNSFYITGMSCSSCVSKITSAVNVRPDASITISLVTAQATVKLHDGGPPSPKVLAEVKGVVTKLGFGVEEGDQEGGVDEFKNWR
ncbi:hypothetical protein TrRE_jg9643, partial [Triparma retinervis]